MAIRNVTYYGVVSPGASTIAGESVGTGNGSTTTFTHTAADLPVLPGSVVITAGAIVATDNGSGTLTGTGISSGTVNYSTGAISITYSTAPVNLLAITATYIYGSSGKQFNELVPKPGGILVSQKIIPSNVINQAQGTPTESGTIGVVIQGSFTGVAGTWIQIASGTVVGGGAAVFDWGFAQYPYINFFSTGLCHLSIIWDNPTI